MKTIKLTPAVSNKPCDIEYRLKRAAALASECEQFLNGIEPGSFEGDSRQAYDAAVTLVSRLGERIGSLHDSAPKKRVHVKQADKPIVVKEPKVKKVKKVVVQPEVDEELAVVSEELIVRGVEFPTLDEALEAAAE